MRDISKEEHIINNLKQNNPIMANPKLEFFRFKLNHKSGENKTFRHFILGTGRCTLRQKDNAIFGALYKYFMSWWKANE